MKKLFEVGVKEGELRPRIKRWGLRLYWPLHLYIIMPLLKFNIGILTMWEDAAWKVPPNVFYPEVLGYRFTIDFYLTSPMIPVRRKKC